MGWLVFVAYAGIWLGYGWRLTVYLLDAQVRKSLSKFRSLYSGPDAAARAAAEWRGMYLLAGFTLAAGWPVVAPARGLYRLLVGRVHAFRTPVEVEYAERAELEQLRQLAREHRLPMPRSGPER